MKILLINLAILIIAFTVGFNRHDKIEELQAINSQLNSHAETIPEIKGEIERLGSIQIDTDTLEELRGETVELMRLRAEISKLNSRDGLTTSDIEQEIEQIKSEILQAQEALEFEVDWIVENLTDQLKRQIASTLSDEIDQYIKIHGTFPDSLEPFQQAVSAVVNLETYSNRTYGWLYFDYKPNLPRDIAMRINPGVKDYELLSTPQEFEATNKPVLAFRERVPRQSPDSIPVRQYGIYSAGQTMVDVGYGAIGFGGRSSNFRELQIGFADGDFEKWEREFAEANGSN